MTDRGERQILWFLTLLIGVGICGFSLSGQDSSSTIRLVFLPLGVFIVVVATVRIRRLGRRRSGRGEQE